VELAQGTEAANKHHSEMKTPSRASLCRQSPQGLLVTLNQLPPIKSNACYRCGVTEHKASEYRFKDKTCHNCKKKHIAKVCRSKPKSTRTAKHRSKKVHQVSEQSDSESDREERERIWGVDLLEDRGERVPPISVCVQLAGNEVTMELDTGASVSV